MLLAGRYAYDGEIGTGSTGRVIGLRDVVGAGPDGEQRVGKILDAAAGARAQWELDALLAIESPHVAVAIELLRVHEPLAAPFAIPRGSWVLVQARARGDRSTDVVSAIEDPARRGARLVDLTVGLARGLSALHARGLSHGDVKPDNVLVEGSHATLIDLGAAAPFGRSDTLSGTLELMSAEAREGERSPATDLHALGATVMLWATGRVPTRDEAPALPDWVPPKLATLVAALVSEETSERPLDAERVIEALTGERASPALRSHVPAVGLELAIERLVAVLDAHGWAWVVGPRGSGRSRWIEEAARAIQRREARAGRGSPTYLRTTTRGGQAPDHAALIHLDFPEASAADAERLVTDGRLLGALHRVVLESAVEPAASEAAWTVRVPLVTEEEAQALLARVTGEAPSRAVARAAMEATGGLAGRVVRGVSSLTALGLDPHRAADWSLVSRTVEGRAAPRAALEVAALGAVLGGVIELDPARARELPASFAEGARWLLRERLATIHDDGSLTLHGSLVDESALAREQRARALAAASKLPLAGLSRAICEARGHGHESADRSVHAIAREARERGEPERAAALLDRYLASTPRREGATRANLLLLHAEARASSGELAHALSALELAVPETGAHRVLTGEILRLAGRTDDAIAAIGAARADGAWSAQDADDVAALDARIALARDPEDAADRARRLLDVATPSARARAREILALVCLRKESNDEALTHARAGGVDAASIERIAARRTAQARLVSVEAHASARLGRLDDARALHEESARLATLAGDRLLEATFHVNEGLACLEHGELGASLRALEKGARLFLRLDRPRELARATANFANAACLAGDDARARLLIAEAARALASVDDPEAATLVAIVRSEVLARRGKLRAACTTLEGVPLDESAMSIVAHARLASARAALGSHELARDTLAPLLAVDTVSECELAVARTRLALAMGDREAAARSLEHASTLADRGAVGFELRQRTLVLAVELAEAHGRRAEARAHLGRLRALLEPTLRDLSPELQARFRQIPSVRRALAEGSVGGPAVGRPAELALDALAALAREPRLDALDERLASLALEVSAAERAFVVEWGAEGPVVKARAGAADPSARPSSSIVARALRETCVVSADAVHERDASSSVHALALRSVIAIEILPRPSATPRRVLVLDDALRAEAFDGAVVSALRDLVEVAGSLTAARLDARRARARGRRAAQREADAEADARRAREGAGEGALDPFEAFVHVDPVTAQLVDEARRLAVSDLPLLIVGESGVGKDLLARAMHRASPRRHEPFVAERAGALAGPLAEAALFGHVRGAFTGADTARKGLFEQADGGTLFLDGIEDLAPEMQAKLLRILVDSEVRPLGASRARRLDVRLIATMRVPPEDALARGLREDFYYRVAGARLVVPPLRERPLDLDRLIDRSIARSGRAIRVSSRARDALRARRWPGNVRELEHALTEALLRVDDGVLDVAALTGGASPPGEASETTSLHAQRGALTRELVLETLERHHGNRTHAARALGLSRFGLQKMLKRLSPHAPSQSSTRRAK